MGSLTSLSPLMSAKSRDSLVDVVLMLDTRVPYNINVNNYNDHDPYHSDDIPTW